MKAKNTQLSNANEIRSSNPCQLSAQRHEPSIIKMDIIGGSVPLVILSDTIALADRPWARMPRASNFLGKKINSNLP